MKYMLLIYSNESQDIDVTPEKMNEMIGAYNAYIQRLVDAGVFISTEALQPSATATTIKVRHGETLTTHGPFVETVEQLGGYFLLECDNLDAAIEWAAQCPGSYYGSIEIRPVMDYEQA